MNPPQRISTARRLNEVHLSENNRVVRTSGSDMNNNQDHTDSAIYTAANHTPSRTDNIKEESVSCEEGDLSDTERNLPTDPVPCIKEEEVNLTTSDNDNATEGLESQVSSVKEEYVSRGDDTDMDYADNEIYRRTDDAQYETFLIKKESIAIKEENKNNAIADLSQQACTYIKEEAVSPEGNAMDGDDYGPPVDHTSLDYICVKIKQESVSSEEDNSDNDAHPPSDQQLNSSKSGQKSAPESHRIYNWSKCENINSFSDFIAQQSVPPKMKLSCSECGKPFPYKSQLIRHQRTHTGEKPFPCPECGKCFTCKSEVVKHQVTHTREKSYSCPECGKSFMRQSSLINHRITHTDQKPFSCSECGKSFKWQYNLSLHQRIHTGEKPYECSACGKCFTCRSNLIYHQRTHTGEKPFTCSQCGVCFAFKPQLTRHEKTHV